MPVWIRIRLDVRRQMIKDIEKNYQGSQFEQDTGWYKFIQQGWSRILTQKEPEQLDTRYLAEQCNKNLLTVIDNGGIGRQGGTTVGKSPKREPFRCKRRMAIRARETGDCDEDGTPIRRDRGNMLLVPGDVVPAAKHIWSGSVGVIRSNASASRICRDAR